MRKGKRFGQLALVIVAFVFALLCIGILESPGVLGVACGAFLGVAGAYTALDLRSVVKSTGTMPPGAYQKAERWKYFLCIVMLFVLFVMCFFRQQASGMSMDLAYGFLVPGILGIFAVIISGMKMNKAATLSGPQPPGLEAATTKKK